MGQFAIIIGIAPECVSVCFCCTPAVANTPVDISIRIHRGDQAIQATVPEFLNLG